MEVTIAAMFGVSPDRKNAYFLGVTRSEIDRFAAESNNIIGDKKLVWENDPLMDEVHNLWTKYSVVNLDLTTMRVVGTNDASLQGTMYNRYWTSPNGKHILYTQGYEERYVQYMKVGDNNVKLLELPTKSSAQAWGGSTSAPSPKFSPNGENIIYDATDGRIGTIGVINLSDDPT